MPLCFPSLSCSFPIFFLRGKVAVVACACLLVGQFEKLDASEQKSVDQEMTEEEWAAKREEVMRWMVLYHQHPEPSSVAKRIEEFSQYGFLLDMRSTATILGFAWQLFRENEAYLDQWMEAVHNKLPINQQIPFVLALHMANSPTALGIIDEQLTKPGDMGRLYRSVNNVDPETYYSLEALLATEPAKIRPDAVPICLGAFYASGNVDFLRVIKNYATYDSQDQDRATARAVLEIIGVQFD